MDKLRALRYFKRASELNSFSLTAEEFDVPASSISRRIKDLEKELGVELLQRTTRNVSTTELGSVYYDMIVDVLQKLNEADELVSQRHGAMEGKIRISAMPDYGARVLSPVLHKFREKYPAITFDLDYSDDPISLSASDVDIAIRAGKVPEERVVAKHLSSAALKLVATPRLLRDLQKRFGRSILTAEDLGACPTLQYLGKHGHASWWQFKEEVWHEIEINPVLRCNSGEALLSAVLAHEGISLYPLWWVKNYLASGELIEVPVDVPVSIYQGANFDVSVLYQQAKYKIPKIKCCIDFIVEHLG